MIGYLSYGVFLAILKDLNLALYEMKSFFFTYMECASSSITFALAWFNYGGRMGGMRKGRDGWREGELKYLDIDNEASFPCWSI